MDAVKIKCCKMEYRTPMEPAELDGFRTKDGKYAFKHQLTGNYMRYNYHAGKGNSLDVTNHVMGGWEQFYLRPIQGTSVFDIATHANHAMSLWHSGKNDDVRDAYWIKDLLAAGP
jgi:hypothetical protein